MSIRIPRWFGSPPEFFELRRHVGISRGALLLFDFLHFMSDKRSSRRLVFEEDELAELSDISKRRLGDARKQLLERGLVVSQRQRGGKYIYELCEVAMGQPYPGDSKAKIGYKKRPKPADEPADETPAVPAIEALPENPGDACELGLENCDTSFPFGWNLVTVAEQQLDMASVW